MVYIVCWKRGKEYNYFYCGEEAACTEFIDKTIEAGFEVVGVDVVEEV